MEFIMAQLFPQFNIRSEDYRKAITKKFTNYLRYSEIPSICIGFNDETIIPDKLHKVYLNIKEAITNRYNFLFIFPTYENISYLCYLFMQKYFKDCLDNHDLVEDVLYIDTKLLVEDYKRLINYDKNELSLAPVHSLETLYKSIENASIVFWDKFLLIDSNYDKDKIFDIINIRNRKGLCNFFFSTMNTAQISKSLGSNISNALHIDLGFDCSKNNLIIQNKKEVSQFKC